MNKGFTLVELLAVLVIVSLLGSLAVVSMGGLTNRSKNDYYINLANTLELNANSYLKDNRSKRYPTINDTCGKVSFKELIDAKLIESALDANGKSCDINNSFVYFKLNTNKKYEYNTKFVCNNYNSNFDEQAYCEYVNTSTSNIILTATSNNNPYSVTGSYSNTLWVSNDVIVNFNSNRDVSKYVISNTIDDNEFECNAINNTCDYTFTEKGIYSVEAYNNEELISTRSFNIKIDKDIPTFEIDNKENRTITENNSLNYQNKVINIVDSSGVSKIEVYLYKKNELISNKYFTNTDTFTLNSLPSGNYKLDVYITDFVGNKSSKQSINFQVNRNIILNTLNDNNDTYTHNILDEYIFGYYEELPILERNNYTFVGWSRTSSREQLINNQTLVKPNDMVLYAIWE